MKAGILVLMGLFSLTLASSRLDGAAEWEDLEDMAAYYGMTLDDLLAMIKEEDMESSTRGRFSSCGGSAININIGSIQAPNPIRIREGLKVRVGASGSIGTNLPNRVKLSVKIEKKILWGYVALPCVKKLGSCDYDLPCSHPLIRKYGITCPPPSGKFSLYRDITIPAIDVPGWLASGEYNVKVQIKDYYNGNLLGCFQGNALSVST